MASSDPPAARLVLAHVAMGFIDRESAHGLIPLTIGVTLTLALLGALGARTAVLRLPPDFLEAPPAPLSRTRSAVRAVAGAALVGLGIALLVLPGPGMVLIVLGALMLAPTWRSRIVRSIVSRPRILREVNAFRRRHGCTELDMPRSPRDR